MAILQESPSRTNVPIYKSRAIVIRRRNQGESDRVLTLFSNEKGRFSAIAKGGRKPKSKLAGGIELFTENDFILSDGKAFEIVSETQLLHNYLDGKPIHEIKLAHLFAELVCKLIPENLPVPELFSDFELVLSRMGQDDSDLLELFFCSRLLKYLGIYPELAVCLDCKQKPEQQVYFSASSGGIVCESCYDHTHQGSLISKDVIKLWRFLMECNPDVLDRLNIEDSVSHEATSLMRSYLTKATGVNFNSLEIAD